MATYSNGLSDKGWNDYENQWSSGNWYDPTTANAGLSAGATIKADGIDDLYKSIGLDRNIEIGKNAYAQNLTPEQVVGGAVPEKGLSDWFGNKGNQAMIGAGLGVGQLGLGLASYLEQSDFMKKQGKLLDQQLASNQYNIDRQKTSDEANRRSYEAAENRRSGIQPTATA